ncbi:leucine-rich repeat-containing protein 38 [Electrophorus electricus]|uniref:LRRNT domain-containing protein n=1 Tax=Electrophorus electricus TaxID=8005 RepID=A0A4W4EYG4_ELEEL|nr:leucine-rich repeat-containing protein 38 [Electrophorus electricus]
MFSCVCCLQSFLVLLSIASVTLGQRCPASCLCPDHHTVDCTGQGLTRLPDSIPLGVRRLLLADNGILWIPSDFLVVYSDLVYLDLRNNSLTKLEPGTLPTFSRLVYLDLRNNNLTEIPSGTFGESHSLIKLRLGNNPYLSMLSRGALAGLTSLRELELERNGFSVLDVGMLRQLPSLRIIRLEGNPWVCNCRFTKLFFWLVENHHKLPNGLEDMECLLPVNGQWISLSMLSENSFRECLGVLSLKDLLVVMFSGIVILVISITTSFIMASIISYVQQQRMKMLAEEEGLE